MGFVLPLWSAFLQHRKKLDRVVSAARFLTGGVFESDIAHRRHVAISCMLFKIRCNAMHPLYGALHFSQRVTRATLVGCTSIYLCASLLHKLEENR